MAQKLNDGQFREAWFSAGCEARIMAEITGLGVRAIYDRRNVLEQRHGWRLPSAGSGNGVGRGDQGTPAWNYKPRLEIDNFSGLLVTFSDAHFWPGISETLAYRALLEVIRQEKPKLIIANGDLLDGARISRHGRTRWEESPRLSDELEEVKLRMAEIRHACRSSRLIRTIGNHDSRFETYLSGKASEMEGVEGSKLEDHLVGWEQSMSIFINKSCMVKHRIGQGRQAAYTNLLKAGVSGQTGHTHRLKVEPFGDYRGRRYWGESGTLAEPAGVQFSYGEDNPTEACSGFLTTLFDKNGFMFAPQMVEVQGGRATWRDDVILSERRKVAA